jgi:hypothetical protein
MVGSVNLRTTKGVSRDLTRMEAILASHCIDFCQGHARWVWHAIACLGPGPGQIKAQATQSLFSRSKYCGFQKMDVGGRVLLTR